jgi:hypothetical protein
MAAAEGGELGPAQAAVGEDENGEAARAGGLGQCLDLARIEITATTLPQRRQRDAGSRVAR